VKENQIVAISRKLSHLIVNGNASLRDIYSICMKTLITDVPDSMSKAVTFNLVDSLISGIESQTEDVKKECLDNIGDLLKRFGHLLREAEFNRIMSATFSQLKHPRGTIRKRASNTLGALAFVVSDQSLNELISALLTRIEELESGSKSNKASAECTTLISTIGVISRTVGYKLSKYLDRIVPLFIRFCGSPDDEDLQNEQGNELRESCFPGLESIVIRCPKEITPYISEILSNALLFTKYDPNYAFDDEDEDRMEVEDDAGEEGFEDEYDAEEMGSDNDDSSWKVRKSAVKVINAIIVAHPQGVRELYHRCGDELLRCFKEREENVRLDIIACYTRLVELNLPISTDEGESEIFTQLQKPTLMRQKSTSSLLEERVDAIVRGSIVQLSGKSTLSKIAIVRLLKAIVHALQVKVTQYVF
jgi:hypothetical protein